MQKLKWIIPALVVIVMTVPVSVAGDWGKEAAKRVVGRVAREAMEEALEDASLANRELTFPNTREAGIDAGTGIAQDCKADPQALLYAVVDKHARRVAEAGKAASLR